MIDLKRNKEINEELRKLYKANTDEFLKEYKKAFTRDENPPKRINEFGIIDEENYDTDNGILVIAKETNGWDNEEFEKGELFRTWMQDISRYGIKGRGHVSSHPTMWYNILRWIKTIQNPEMPTEEIACLKEYGVETLGTIAFTNINKVRGNTAAKKAYHQIAKTQVARRVLEEEIGIIKPKVILCCGTGYYFDKYIKNEEIEKNRCKVIYMPHPAARKNKEKMIDDLKSKLKKVPLT